jgi:N-terminal domain of reverse transcriptase
MGSPSAGHRRGPPALGAHRPGADGPRKDGAGAGGARARCAPTTHQEDASHRGFSERSPASAGLLYGKPFGLYDTIKPPTGIASYRATQCGAIRTVRKLQKLLMKSWYARLLAVRRVTQDNRGKQTAGIDGVKSLTPVQRWHLANTLCLDGQATPLLRTWIPSVAIATNALWGFQPNTTGHGKRSSAKPWNPHGKRSSRRIPMAFAPGAHVGMPLKPSSTGSPFGPNTCSKLTSPSVWSRTCWLRILFRDLSHAL